MKYEKNQEKPQTPLVLDIAGLTSHYGRIQALHGIDLQVRQGQLVALVGANGAGKTTLLRAISGVQPISAGSIAFAGQDVSRMSADKRVRAGICQVPEGRQVFGPMTVEDNLRLGAFTRPAQDVAGDMERMYGLFPILKEKRLLLAGTLSGGQQQMLAMARALMGRPQLLLLDEPSMGLAPLADRGNLPHRGRTARPGHHHLPRRAERARGPVDRRRGLCDRDGRHHPVRPRSRIAA